MGFHMETAKALVVDGQPAVELRLTDGAHYATVTEQHPVTGQAAVQAAAAGSAPGEAPGAGGVAGPSQDWATSPSAATYRAAGLTITYRSDLPAAQSNQALPILKRLADSAAEGVAAAVPEPSGGQAADPLGARLERGFSKIAALFNQ